MILCAGEALIDMLPRKSSGGEDAFAPFAGGAVFNTSIALGPPGRRDRAVYRAFHRSFRHTSYGCACCLGCRQRSGPQEPTGPRHWPFVTLSAGQASYAFYDENTAGRILRPDDLPTDLGNVHAMFFGGISLAVEPCASAYEALMLREAPNRATMIDPNIRPSFITDEVAYRARIERMLAAADIVKLSDEDMTWLYGPGDSGAQARALLDRGPRLVCVTKGAEGVTGYMSAREIFVAASRAEVVDTVGAGDTFNAGLLAGLDEAGFLSKTGLSSLDGEGLQRALTRGVRAAAVTVSRAGANPPWARELA